MGRRCAPDEGRGRIQRSDRLRTARPLAAPSCRTRSGPSPSPRRAPDGTGGGTSSPGSERDVDALSPQRFLADAVPVPRRRRLPKPHRAARGRARRRHGEGSSPRGRPMGRSKTTPRHAAQRARATSPDAPRATHSAARAHPSARPRPRRSRVWIVDVPRGNTLPARLRSRCRRRRCCRQRCNSRCNSRCRCMTTAALLDRTRWSP